VGYDEGVVVIKLGKDEPTLSADAQGKMVYTKAGSVPHSAWDGFEGRRTRAASGQVNRLLGGISDIHHTFSERTLLSLAMVNGSLALLSRGRTRPLETIYRSLGDRIRTHTPCSSPRSLSSGSRISRKLERE